MGKIVLLAVAAAWVAVLLPPLLRNRMENRPGSSVTDFRRQLNTLQRTVPTRNMTPMRSMSRPLTQSPLSRPAVHRTSQLQRSGGLGPAVDRYDQGYGYEQRPAYPRQHHHTGELSRRTPRDATTHGHRVAHVPSRQVSRREMVRRRRANVLFVLIATNVLTLFLAATTQSHPMIYGFAFAFVSLCGYCYKLAQLRQYEQDVARTSGETWYHAA